MSDPQVAEESEKVSNVNRPSSAVFKVRSNDIEYELWLPSYETDHIQRKIAATGIPYEHEMLLATINFLHPGSVVVDVGANVGNHAIFWAHHEHPVSAFEPNEAVADIAEANIELNALADRVELHRVALGDHEGTGRVEHLAAGNLGGTRVVMGAGEVSVAELDAFALANVGLIKVDVEGMELEVLRGARQTVLRDRPLLCIETLDHEMLAAVLAEVTPLGYVDWATYNASPTQLFVPEERIPPEDVPAWAADQAIKRLDARVAAESTRASLDQANLKYRAAMTQVSAMKAQLQTLRTHVQSADASSELSSPELMSRLAQLDGALERAAALEETLGQEREARAVSRAVLMEELETIRSSTRAVMDQELMYLREQLQAQRWGLEEARLQERKVYEARLEEAAQRLQGSLDQLDELTVLHDQAVAGRDWALGERDGARRERDAIQAEVASLRADVAHLASQITQERAEVQRLNDQGDGVKNQLEEALGHLAAAREEVERLRVGHRAVSVERDAALQTLTQALADRAALEAQLAATRENHREGIALRDMATADRDAALVARDAALDELEAASSDLKERIVVLGADLARAKDRATARARDLRHQAMRIGELESTIARLHGDKLRMAAHITEIGRERAALREMASSYRSSRTYRTVRLLNLLASPRELVHAVRKKARARGAADAPTLELEPGGAQNLTLMREVADSQSKSTPPLKAGLIDGFVPPQRVSVDTVGIAAPTKHGLKVACILDEFSHACFSPEGDFVQLTPEAWQQELLESQPDLLLVESAWRGVNGSWHNMVAKCGPEIMGIVGWCQERGIPTAFWNKEDPVHFSTFLNLAFQFDAIFTTDLDCVPRYKERLGHDRVHFLPFAAQPRLHNPIERYERQDAVAFAGAFYARYPARTADLQNLLTALSEQKDVLIFDRMFGEGNSDYQFPEEYRRFVVGRLDPAEIDLAYKGYTAALNLNSVKGSQSMFARRVFELMASNTLVISNYTPAIRVLFGDLVVASDSGPEAVRQWRDMEERDPGCRMAKAQALRKILREHTYAHRLRSICEAVGAVGSDSDSTSVTIVTAVGNEAELDRVLAAVARQVRAPQSITAFFTGQGTLAARAGVEIRGLAAVGTTTLGEVAGHATHVAFMHPDDHYGPAYLEDLLLAGAYTSAVVLGKAVAPTEEYGPSEAISARRALVRVAEVHGAHVQQFVKDLGNAQFRWRRQFVIDGFEYRVHGAEQQGEADIVAIDEGFALQELDNVVEDTPARGAACVPVEIEVAELASLFPGGSGDIAVRMDNEALRVESVLKDGQHGYLYADETIPLDRLGWAREGSIYVKAGPGLDLQVALLFLDSAGARISHAMALVNRNNKISVPEGAVTIRLGLRASGPGGLQIEQVFWREYIETTIPVLTRARHMVLTNVYPSYDHLYRNGFVHSRVRGYRAAGLDVGVVCLGNVASPVSREFEGVRVTEMASSDFEKLVDVNGIETVLVHFLDPEMWDVVADPDFSARVHVWVHGSEVQPWWRREYNAASEEQLSSAKLASAARMAFWQEVFGNVPDHLDFVFVSRYFAEEVFEDVGIRLPESKYCIIHNPIDGDVFTYVPKALEQRHKVLSIRPYASRKYANDLSVAAVLALAKEPFFGDLTFTFIGDGPMFDEVLAPLRDLDNVAIERRFLTHAEIATLHKEHGIFLTPTRMDAQGVSRDEAMASGLVPVTSAVAAVPEFVDELCGIMAPAEDHLGLAAGIARISGDPDLFARMSEAAARRVREQSGTGVVITQELALICGEATGEC